MTVMSDAALRDAYARAVSQRADPGRASCPAPEALQALVRAEGAESERIALLDHVLTCARCRGEFELLRAIEQAGGQQARASTWRQPRSWIAVALAASLLLAIGIGTGRHFVDGDLPDDTFRGAADVTLVVPQDAAAAPRSAPLTLAWHRIAGVDRYALELLTADGSVALAQETSDTSITIPAARLPAAGDYRWMVRAAAPAGVDMRSGARRLRLTE